MIHNMPHINHKNSCHKATTRYTRAGHQDIGQELVASTPSAAFEAVGQNVSLLKKRMRRQEQTCPQMLKESSPERSAVEQNAFTTKCKRS